MCTLRTFMAVFIQEGYLPIGETFSKKQFSEFDRHMINEKYHQCDYSSYLPVNI